MNILSKSGFPMKTNEDLNIYIYNLWKRKCISLGEELPLPTFFKHVKSESILFVGMNPSFNKDGYKKELSNSDYEMDT